MKKYLLYVSMATIICSCAADKNETLTIVDVQSVTGSIMENISEIASSVEYIPLETNENSVISFIREVRFENDKYYIYAAREVLVFDKTGKYLYKLNKEGKGPEEYLYLSDFDYSPVSRTAMVLSRDRLLFYNDSGNDFLFSRALKLPQQTGYAGYMPDGINICIADHLTMGTSRNQMQVINPAGDSLFTLPNRYTFTKSPKIVIVFQYDNMIRRKGKSLMIKEVFNDTVYKLDEDLALKPSMVFDTKGLQMTTDYLANVEPAEIMGDQNTMARFLQINDFKEFAGLLFIKYSFEKATYLKAYDPESGLVHEIDSKSLLADDISGGVSIEPRYEYNGILYCWTDAMTLKSHVLSDEFGGLKVKDPASKEKIAKIGSSISETDNFILIRVTPKR